MSKKKNDVHQIGKWALANEKSDIMRTLPNIFWKDNPKSPVAFQSVVKVLRSIIQRFVFVVNTRKTIGSWW